jgi:UV DNA damage endonuclease
MTKLFQRIGYACINTTLQEAGVMTNRNAIKRTFESKGIAHISKLALENVLDLEKIIHWNEQVGLKYYRITSNLFPWMSEYQFEELLDWAEIQRVLSRIGDFVTKHQQRLEFHPSHFTVLGSPKESVVEKSIHDLEQHSRIFDEMGLEPSYWNPINIHIGGVYEDKIATAERWCQSVHRLSENCRKRLVVENDDKANMYSVQDLYELVYKKIGTPITFDIFHHGFCTGGLTAEAAAKLAESTWPVGHMVIHWSSSMKNHEDGGAKAVAHARYIYEPIDGFGTDSWIMCESKAKEKAVLDYLQFGAKK